MSRANRGITATGFIWLFLAAMLSACAHSGPTHFYTLEASAPASPPSSAYAGPPLWVQAVFVPAAMDRLELTTHASAGGITVSDFDRWAAPLEQLSRQALTQDLAARLPRGLVIFPDAPRPAETARLSVDILSFSHGGSRATMQVSWTLSPMGSSPAPARGGEALLDADVTAPGPAGDAEAFGVLLGKLSDAIAVAVTPRAP